MSEASAVPGAVRVDHFVQPGSGASQHGSVRLGVSLPLRQHQLEARFCQVPGGVWLCGCQCASGPATDSRWWVGVSSYMYLAVALAHLDDFDNACQSYNKALELERYTPLVVVSDTNVRQTLTRSHTHARHGLCL